MFVRVGNLKSKIQNRKSRLWYSRILYNSTLVILAWMAAHRRIWYYTRCGRHARIVVAPVRNILSISRGWCYASRRNQNGARTYRTARRPGATLGHPALLRYRGDDAGCDLARHRRAGFRDSRSDPRGRRPLARRGPDGIYLELGSARATRGAGRALGAPLWRSL